MRNEIARRHGCVLLSATALLINMSCHALPVANSGAGLQLTAHTSRTEARAEDVIVIELALVNGDDREALFCLGAGRAIHLNGLDPRYAKTMAAVVVDHPFCEHRLKLPPRGQYQFRETFSISDQIPEGLAEILVTQQIVDPLRCDPKYGCRSKWLSARAGSLKIMPRAASPY